MFNKTIEGPWPYGEMWWLACGKDEGEFAVYGPFPSLDDYEKELERSYGCDRIHFPVNGEPDPKIKSNVQRCFPLRGDWGESLDVWWKWWGNIDDERENVE